MAAIVEQFGGGPVGLDAVAAAISEEKGTIEDVIEPYLIRKATWCARPAAVSRRQSAFAFRPDVPERGDSLANENRQQQIPNLSE